MRRTPQRGLKNAQRLSIYELNAINPYADSMKVDPAQSAGPVPRVAAAPSRAGRPGEERAPDKARAAAAAAAESAAEAGAAELESARQAANRVLAQKGSELAFEFDDELGRVIAKLIDRNTREVIRQVPSEAVLAVARALADGVAPGTLVKSNA